MLSLWIDIESDLKFYISWSIGKVKALLCLHKIIANLLIVK